MDFIESSYLAHSKLSAAIKSDSEVYENWFEKGTTDVWRHVRMLSCLDPLLENFKSAQWITIGDGTFGTSCIYIEKKGGNCVATDIDETKLIEAHAKGWIRSFKCENAEHLSLDDNSVDFAYCKEAFHHFPRPHLGLYEMLRVSRKAVIFTEPTDWLPGPVLKQVLVKIKRFVKRIAGRRIEHTDTGNFEEIGNYVFTISIREFEKIAMAMGLPAIAYRYFHDVYFPGMETEQASDRSPLFRRMQRKIKLNEVLNKLSLNSKNQVSVILFKDIPDIDLRSQLAKSNFTVSMLPQSPKFSS